ncbi:MAG: hypothetical protein H6Q33_4809, partial [Deltaproteobacteria bacterium]|nr:hypothetical protein [Deltaproteobacteria bacterium]
MIAFHTSMITSTIMAMLTERARSRNGEGQVAQRHGHRIEDALPCRRVDNREL